MGEAVGGTDESITKELREWVSKYIEAVLDKRDLLVMADRIDKAHEEEVREARLSGHHESDETWLQALDDVTDEWLAEHGLVRLPVDADGETWHVGDKFDHAGSTFTVVSLAFGRPNGWTLRVGNVVVPASHVRHHKPTTADRIRAAVQKLTDEDGSDGTALSDLLAIADELEADDE